MLIEMSAVEWLYSPSLVAKQTDYQRVLPNVLFDMNINWHIQVDKSKVGMYPPKSGLVVG